MIPIQHGRRWGVQEGDPAVSEHEDVSTRVLLIEDDDRIRETTRLVFEDEGYEVDEAASAESGLVMFGQRSPGCVIVDLMLPGLNGFECCRALRQSSDVPFVVVTARTGTHDLVAGLEAGADDYITKPFHPKELTARLRALMRCATNWKTTPATRPMF